jgi:hypothetical protein
MEAKETLNEQDIAELAEFFDLLARFDYEDKLKTKNDTDAKNDESFK